MTSSRTRRVAIVLAGLAGVALLVVGAFFGPSTNDTARAGSARRPATTRRTTTTTTTRRVATTTTLAPVAPPSTTLPLPAPSTAPPSAPPETDAPVDTAPDEPAAEPLTPPSDVDVSVDPASCTWDAADGGTLRASGTVTNTANDDDTWLVSVDWIDGEDFLDSESDFFEAAPGQSVPWSLTIVGSEAPIGALSCEVQVL